MGTKNHTDWASLSHAYGSAEDIPALLEKAKVDTRGGHIPNSTWFDLWSALCHQGDTYSASYAAVPFLVNLAELPAYSAQYDPLLLAASIEASRVEEGSVELSAYLAADYGAALLRGEELAALALQKRLDLDSRRAFEGCGPAFRGDFEAAREIWDQED